MDKNNCLNCKIELKSKNKFCSPICASKYWNKNHKEECIIAQKEFHKKNPNYSKEHRKKWRKENPEKYQEQRKRWREKNKDNPSEKIKASSRRKANYKIELKEKCEICEVNKAIERHHNDYSKPLETISVCKSCHLNINNNIIMEVK